MTDMTEISTKVQNQTLNKELRSWSYTKNSTTWKEAPFSSAVKWKGLCLGVQEAVCKSAVVLFETTRGGNRKKRRKEVIVSSKLIHLPQHKHLNLSLQRQTKGELGLRENQQLGI